MKTLWFTADLHLGHTNIIRYQNRPFNDIQEMDAKLILAINACVMPGDTLWVLGDFSFQNPSQYLERITCKDVRLIRGNHDNKQAHHRFMHCYDLYAIKFGEQRVVLCHYPLLRWRASHHGSWHLFGHCHGKLIHPSPNAMDVGVDVHNYQPLSQMDIERRLKENGTGEQVQEGP